MAVLVLMRYLNDKRMDMRLRYKSVLLCFWVFSAVLPAKSQNSEVDTLPQKNIQQRVFGYVKESPSLQFYSDDSDVFFNNILQLRLNATISYKNTVRFNFGMRNRLFSGYMVQEYGDMLAEFLKHDSGYMQVSFVPVSNSTVLLHSAIDRLYVDWQKDTWQFRLGRQRVNWGIAMVSNPNDIFNTYSFFDFDYEERPGADALRIQKFTGNLSRVELAVAPQKDIQESVAGLLYAHNMRGYDFQTIVGYYKHKATVGFGWTGNIKTLGFKGETMVYSALEDMDSITFISTVGFDYMFPNSLFVFTEFLYNGGHVGVQNGEVSITQALRADNIFISKYALSMSALYPISPILTCNVSTVYMPDISSIYIIPTLTYSLVQNLDVSIVGQTLFSFEKEQSSQTSLFLQAKLSF